MNWIKEIKWFIQRGRRGWADCDAWNANDYLAEIIPPLLRKMKGGNGCPSEFYDVHNTNNECQKWEEVIEEIAQGFEATKERLFVKWIPTEHGHKMESDIEASDNAHKKTQRGLELFAKHYHSLWD